MNLVYDKPSVPLRVLLVNATQDVMSMVAIKILRGIPFGEIQMIDLMLLVYADEVPKAEELRWNLEGSALPCSNNITITTDIPRITDADVFIFISNFPNSNNFEIDKVNSVDYFDSLYLFLKIANNFEMPEPIDEELNIEKKNCNLQTNEPKRPVIITDGIVTLDIIKSFSKNLPDDIFFCPSSISALSRSILSDYLKVPSSYINYVNVWAANDNVFYVKVESPIYIRERKRKRNHCDWEDMGEKTFHDLDLDWTHFNSTWMRKDFMAKIYEASSTHPRGNIYNSVKIAQTLKNIWKTRSLNPAPRHRCNLGVISDGSIGTIKGLPYYLPVTLTGDVFTINDSLKDDIYLKQEVKRINKAALQQHENLIHYCKIFLHKYVLQPLEKSVASIPKARRSSFAGSTRWELKRETMSSSEESSIFSMFDVMTDDITILGTRRSEESTILSTRRSKETLISGIRQADEMLKVRTRRRRLEDSSVMVHASPSVESIVGV